MQFIIIYKVDVTLQVDVLNIRQASCWVPVRPMIILINNTNTFKNHNLVFFCNGIFLATKGETTTRIDEIKRKKG
jgi:hypothetical protein